MRRLRAASIALFIIALLLLGANLLNQRVFSDQTGPVFKMENKTIEISVHDSAQELLKGLEAEDASDGDVTDSIIQKRADLYRLFTCSFQSEKAALICYECDESA